MWFFLGLVIESTIIPLELIFEHRMYFASIGLTLSVVVAAYSLFTSMLSRMQAADQRKLCWSLFAIVASVLALTTFTRNSDWKDSVTLNGDNALKAPNNHRAHVNYAVALSQAGRYREAIEEANIAIKLGRPNFDSYCEAADAIVLSYFGLNEFEEAAREGERLLRERPDNAGSSALAFTHLSLAYSYAELGRLQEAYACILKGLRTNQQLTLPMTHLKNTAVNLLSIILDRAGATGSDLDEDGTLDPGRFTHRVWIAQTFLKLGDRSEAREILQAAAYGNVDDQEALQLLDSIIRDDLKNAIQQAKGSYKERYVYHPFSQFHASMALAFLIREQQSLHRFINLGERLVDNAINLQPDSADAHLLKGWYHFGRNEFVGAVGKAKKAIELDPNDAKICLGLGFFLAQAGHPHEAIDALQKALDLYPDHPQRRAVLNVIGNLRSETTKLAKDAAAITN
jgi:tetratricopeptide (TPR) repeat protein